MNNWNQIINKKESELRDLEYFLEEYNYIQKTSLEIIDLTERPDFICKNKDGQKIGIELTKITRDPESRLWDRILRHEEYITTEKAIELLQIQAIEKDEKRKGDNWTLSDNTILVLQLMDIPLHELHPLLNLEILPDLDSLGFKEIWLVDYTRIEPYDDIELFCLYPQDLWGYYKQSIKKPYG